MSEHGLLVVLFGLSGVGKGTVRKAIFESENDGFQHSVSMTTRKMREEEAEGVDYFFRSKEGSESMIEAGEMLEYAEYIGDYYGTPLLYVNKTLDEGRDVFLEIEVREARQVKEEVPDSVFIFLTPPDLAKLKSRIVGRGTDAGEVIKEQTKVAKKEIEIATLCDYVAVNDEVPLVVERIKNVIVSERLRVDRVIDKYIKMLKEIQSYDVKTLN